MIVPKACPACGGDVVVAHEDKQNSATCQKCAYTTDVETMRRQMTLRALQSQRERERRQQAAV